ncbi:acetyl-CoA C-acetyltransferase [Nitrobacteraceae bacterium AZCC 2146]
MSEKSEHKKMAMTFPEDRIPVIVGVGEFSNHPKELTAGLEPLALMVEALKRAEQDAGGKLLHDIDSLDIVNFLSWRYSDPAKQLSDKLGIAPKHAYYGPVGGESPIRYIHEAAQRIARGEASVAAICGAEAQSTATKAERAGVTLPWTPFAKDAPEPLRGANYQKPMATMLGVAKPVTVYPFYEAASAAHWGQTPREAHQESGELWSRYAGVAAQNPEAWLKRSYTPEAITQPSPDNRLIAWPYTKLMVANPMVNQSAAILVTSLAKARAAGVPESRMVHIWGGASAEEPRDYLDRDQYVESHAQNAVLKATMNLVDGDSKAFDAIELYSCFPCVPKMARRTLGLGADVQPTVTGGLTFFGAPLNDYMAHAACAMVRKLRAGAKVGLLYGQGGFVTKHHALVVSREAPRATLSQNTNVQAEADRNRKPVPKYVTEASGNGTVESFTVIYGRNGDAEHGVVILRTADNARALARVPAQDTATLAHLLNMDRTPVGSSGTISTAGDGVLEWRVG